MDYLSLESMFHKEFPCAVLLNVTYMHTESTEYINVLNAIRKLLQLSLTLDNTVSRDNKLKVERNLQRNSVLLFNHFDLQYSNPTEYTSYMKLFLQPEHLHPKMEGF